MAFSPLVYLDLIDTQICEIVQHKKANLETISRKFQHEN